MFSLFSKGKKDKRADAIDPQGRRTNDTPSKGRSSQPPTQVQECVPGPITHVRSMIEGTGGTFAFRDLSMAKDSGVRLQRARVHALQPGQYIGTTKCRTCVGVYFEIGSDRCFCAHLNFSIKSVDPITRPGPEPPVDARTIREAVQRRLERYRRLQEWHIKDVKKESLIVVCPSPARYGTAALRAILDFLGLTSGTESIMIQHAHGFVIQPGQPKSMKIIPYDHTAKEMKDRFGRLERFQLNGDFTLPEKEWQYSCPDRRWFIELG